MARRGLTLVELLAALALVVVLSALAMPAVQGRLEDARFESGQRQVEAAIMVCRAEAQRRGRAMSLSVLTAGAGELGLYIEPIDAAASAMVAAPAEPEDGPEGTPVAPPVEAEEGAADHGREPAWAVLPPRIRVSATPPAAEDDRAADILPDRAEAAAIAESPVRLTIAVFFPDGSAASRGPVFIVSGRRAASLRVNRWTGSASVEAYVPPEPGEPEAEDRPAAESSGEDGEAQP